MDFSFQLVAIKNRACIFSEKVLTGLALVSFELRIRSGGKSKTKGFESTSSCNIHISKRDAQRLPTLSCKLAKESEQMARSDESNS